MIPAKTVQEAQLAVRAADSFPARGLKVGAHDSSFILSGTVLYRSDLEAAQKALQGRFPDIAIDTQEVKIDPRQPAARGRFTA